MYRRAVLTIEGQVGWSFKLFYKPDNRTRRVKADYLFSYQPPINLIALLIMLPASWVLSPRWFHKVRGASLLKCGKNSWNSRSTYSWSGVLRPHTLYHSVTDKSPGWQASRFCYSSHIMSVKRNIFKQLRLQRLSLPQLSELWRHFPEALKDWVGAHFLVGDVCRLSVCSVFWGPFCWQRPRHRHGLYDS